MNYLIKFREKLYDTLLNKAVRFSGIIISSMIKRIKKKLYSCYFINILLLILTTTFITY